MTIFNTKDEITPHIRIKLLEYDFKQILHFALFCFPFAALCSPLHLTDFFALVIHFATLSTSLRSPLHLTIRYVSINLKDVLLMDKKKDIMESEPNEKCAKRASTHEASSSKKKIK
uniref:Uncharacterized protein n=1 Tax=Cucumis melo TaxID=3656 RepID=A0A9I9EGT3_CUCME